MIRRFALWFDSRSPLQAAGLAVGVIAAVLLILFGPLITRGGLYPSDTSMITVGMRPNPLSYLWTDISTMWQDYSSIRPIALWVLAATDRVFGFSPPAYHSVNLLLVFFNLMAIYTLVRDLTQSAARGLIASLLHITHYVNAGVVLQVASQVEPITCFFFVLSCVFFNRYLNDESSRKWLVLSLAAYLLACFSKEQGVQVPFVLTALLLLRQGFSVKNLLFKVGPFFLAAAAFLGYRSWIIGKAVGGYAVYFQDISILKKAATFVTNYCHVWLMAFWAGDFPGWAIDVARWRTFEQWVWALQGFSGRISLELGLVVTALLSGLWLAATQSLDKPVERKIVIFGFLWVILTSLVFFTLSRFRFAFLPSVGAVLVMASLIYIGPARGPLVWMHRISTLGLVAFSLARMFFIPPDEGQLRDALDPLRFQDTGSYAALTSDYYVQNLHPEVLKYVEENYYPHHRKNP